MSMQMKQRDFVTIADLSKEKIQYLIDLSQEFEKHPNRELLKGKVIASLFFEPSTRTRLSFETAANRLGARIIGFSDAKATSVSKGETLKDTILMVANYADVIVMRHYIEGAAQYASEVSPVPIINAGDGAHMLHSACSTFTPYIRRKERSKTSTFTSWATSNTVERCTRSSWPCAISTPLSTSLHPKS